MFCMLLFHLVISHTVFVKGVHPFDVEKWLDIYLLECLQQYCYYCVGKVARKVCRPMDTQRLYSIKLYVNMITKGKEVDVAYKKAFSQYMA
jgi:hypothetical protein